MDARDLIKLAVSLHDLEGAFRREDLLKAYKDFVGFTPADLSTKAAIANAFYGESYPEFQKLLRTVTPNVNPQVWKYSRTFQYAPKELINGL